MRRAGWIAALALTGCGEGGVWTPPEGPADLDDGWDAPLGSGVTYILRSAGVFPGGVGLDLDGACTVAGCQDNLLGRLRPYIDALIGQEIWQGTLRLMVEVAGLDDPSRWEDPRVTVKIYPVLDEDQPPDTLDDFFPVVGPCCRFRPDPDALAPGTRQPATRLRARLASGVLRSVGEGTLWFPLGFSDRLVRLERARLQVPLQAAGAPELAGIVGGAVSGAFAREVPGCLEDIGAPVCASPDDTLLDLLASLAGSPDLDLDGDGLERFDVARPGTGRITACYDGCRGSCAQVPALAPLDPEDPASCARLPEVADGYTVAYDVRLVEATLVQ